MPALVVLCPNEALDQYIEPAMEMLKPAIEQSGGRLDDYTVRRLLINDLAQFWMVVDADTHEMIAALVTEYRDYPNPMLHVMLCAGTRMEEWLEEIVYRLKKFAKYNGAQRLEIYGRTGWERALSKYGFKKLPVLVMELEVE